jgi:phosphatidylserine decarboxylase
MVRDGYLYALAFLAVGALLGITLGAAYAIPGILLAAFFLWFFRDPERTIPEDPGAIVSPGDGKVTDVSAITVDGQRRLRISIFLNVFNVHVNRTPIAGTVRSVRYQKGQYLNAMNPACAEHNEQSVITLEGEGQEVTFKQIAGLLARRIVCNLKVGDAVARGQRMGLIKFGSRVDVLLEPDARVQVKVGDQVQGGASVLAYHRSGPQQLLDVAAEPVQQGAS